MFVLECVDFPHLTVLETLIEQVVQR